MSRIADLAPGEMTAEQRALHERIAGTRSGAVRGPFAIWLRTPEIAAAADAFGTVLRRGKLERRLFELMTLCVARRWTAQYEWFAHVKHAGPAGLSEEVVEAIRAHRLPPFEREDERLVYEVVAELTETRRLLDATYERCVALLGIEQTIELITAIGFYTTVAIVLNAFEAPVPGGSQPLP